LLPAEALPSEAVIRVDGRVLLFSLVLSLVTGIGFGLVPALHASFAGLGEILRGAGRGSTATRHGGRTRNSLVISSVILSMILLTGAGLMLRSFINLRGEILGFQPAHVLTMGIPVSQEQYSGFEKRNEFFRTVLERVLVLPGVMAATVTAGFPPR